MDILAKPSMDPILDEDIEEKHVYLDDVQVEEDSYKACVVYLLMNLASAYMELRHYSDAIDCFDECLVYAEDKVPDVFFRRSQARTYNKNSSDEDLNLAREDIERAIGLKDEKIYHEHKEKLVAILNERERIEYEKTESKNLLYKFLGLLQRAKKAIDRINEKNLCVDECIFIRNEDADKQYKILKE